MDQVQANLDRSSHIACGLVQYANLTGMVIGYIITASISMVAVHISNCFHENGHNATDCKFTYNSYMIGLGIFFCHPIKDFSSVICRGMNFDVHFVRILMR